MKDKRLTPDKIVKGMRLNLDGRSVTVESVEKSYGSWSGRETWTVYGAGVHRVFYRDDRVTRAY